MSNTASDRYTTGFAGVRGAARPRAGLPPEASYSTTMTPPAECA